MKLPLKIVLNPSTGDWTVVVQEDMYHKWQPLEHVTVSPQKWEELHKEGLTDSDLNQPADTNTPGAPDGTIPLFPNPSTGDWTIVVQEELNQPAGPTPQWTDNPTITGAYWEQLLQSKPEMVWIHDGKIFSSLPGPDVDYSLVKQYVARGWLYYGPIPLPPPMPQPAQPVPSPISAPRWTDNPTTTGAYWEYLPQSELSMVWIHDGKIFSSLPDPTGKYNMVDACVARGCLYYGPIPHPPSPPDKEN